MSIRAASLPVLLGAAAAIASVAAGRARAQSVLLKPRYVQGRTTYLELNEEIEHTVTSDQPGRPPTRVTARQTFGVWHKVEAVSPAGDVRIVLTYDRIRQSYTGPSGSVSFDSDVDNPADASNVLALAMGPMLGMPMTMELNRAGEITSFTGMEAIRKRIEQTTGGGPVYNKMRTELVDDAYKILWGDSRLVLYPNREVKVGDTWTHTLRQQDPALGKLVFEYKCELKSVQTKNGETTATVTYAATVSQAPGNKPPPDADGTVCRLESGAFQGTATFDVRRGAFVKQASQARITIKVIAPNAVGTGLNRTLEQKINSTLNVLTEAQRRAQRRRNRAPAAEEPPDK